MNKFSLLNPKNFTNSYIDKNFEDLMKKTINFFEQKGKTKLKVDDHERTFYVDFLDFVKKEKVFSTLLIPSGYGPNDSRWDTSRIIDYNELLGFYGLHYWYTWQVSILGLGPIWMGDNEDIKHKTAELLEKGGVFAFGLSEKEHGADIYSTEMSLLPTDSGSYIARGSKYYIGNGNIASLVSVFGKFSNQDFQDKKYGHYVFFAVNSQHPKYECVKNLVNVQSFVAEYKLSDYPINESEILSKGRKAWDSSLNTVNVGKFNLGWASIGICTHAFYEAINHASHRSLYGKFVTDFSHIKQFFVDAYSRLIAMKLFALRAGDYMRSANEVDRRYLLYNPMVKMKVTTQGEEVINLLWEIIAAKGFEKDTYFEMATRDIRALPKLEGTVHVNMALIIKFMKNYFFAPKEYPEIPRRNDSKNDDFLFNQGSASGLEKIQFHSYKKTFDQVDLPNVHIFKEQIQFYKKLLVECPPSDEQTKDIDFLLIGGELFTLVVYGQLIIENSKIYNIENNLLDQIFDFIIRDFSKFALQLYSKPVTTEKQMELCIKMIRKPAKNEKRFDQVWKEKVYILKDQYEMTR
jgi:acyl-CoA dehydrogenase